MRSSSISPATHTTQFPLGQSGTGFVYSPLFIIAANKSEGAAQHKLFQIQLFSAVNPRLVVNFPYTPFGSGIAMRTYWDPDSETPNTHSWLDPQSSRTTTQLPKYSHHQDGRAHFSQDGKVYTMIKRQACPIRDINGHAFTMHIQGIEHFPTMDASDEKKLRKGKRGIILFTAGRGAPRMLSLYGSVYQRDFYWAMKRRQGVMGIPHGDYTRYIYPDGRQEIVSVLTDHLDHLDRPNSLLLELRLSTHTIPDTTTDTLLFVGGFDNRDLTKLLDAPGYLALRFPATPDDRDLSLIPSMDFHKPLVTDSILLNDRLEGSTR